ncbi:hypothetical protein ACFV99_37110 [Streptomyces sp. NPDC059944]|uniref:hypothetical protein n=1 Tax=unclassified Streptomyces TaxID=2593676 RepID=UPI00363FA52C
MPKRRKSLIDDVLDRATDVGRDLRDMTSRALTGKEERTSARKLVQRNNRALEALTAQLDQYIQRDRAKEKSHHPSPDTVA